MSAHWPNKMDHHDSLGSRGARTFRRGRVDLEGVGIDVGKDRCCPHDDTTSAVAMNEKSGTMTSSPGPMSRARKR